MTPEQELLDTIEKIRESKFSAIPADLVKQIVLIERNYTDNRQEAYKRISGVIDADLAASAAAKKKAR
jgi:hypothetical protein